jgi:hypothetical protein
MRNYVCAVLLALPLCVWGQSAADMDLALESGAVSFETAARWILPAAGIDGEGDPFAVAERGGLLPPGARRKAAIRLDGLAFMLVRAFGIRGGLLYTLFPGPRYAYRELRYRGVLAGRIDPARNVPGPYFFHLLGNEQFTVRDAK